jgi:transcriptional regulator with XRE-family HTH domain
MPQDPLLSEIAERTRTFSAGTGVSLNKIARMIGVEPGNFSAYMNERIGLSAKATVKLLQLLNLTKRQVEEKLAVKAVNIAHLQKGGREVAETLRFAAPPAKQFEWVPGLSGQDPNGSTDITSTITARDELNADDYLAQTIAMLRDQQQILRQADAHIEAWILNAQKAHPNPNGSTGPARQISRPKTPGPRGDLL